MKTFLAALLFGLGIVNGLGDRVRAENADTAPDELTKIIFEIEDAANNRDLDKVLDYYSEDFTNSDGLSVDSLAEGLEQMWQNYPQLKYTTEIVSWSKEEDLLVAETITTIKGVQKTKGRVTRLNSTIKSRQYFEDDQLVNQDILTEQSQLKSGDNPPKVEIVAPEVVQTGEQYNFDLIVDEPLEEKILLGAIKEEKTASNLYLNPTVLELEPLPAGGIYKTATAPLLPDSNWVSAILVRGDGITMITHRVNMEDSLDKTKK
ncbi:nuclear transport factor 2 family protein [Waterburya agarophytonicola K14]|uniref:Nuclear transport factor 2 family protein n=1 Tax=Waterburya agarophytonicola KI4 TaxID=2874699 RepID=A0A964BQY5_9CYAN|nr:nuclear transport factor 2 family protein [Waterburya agarophytonicola]MCC0176521.1 nuclear transport factor 2 family protein [Waterburya agarophytonicola KI4]